MFILRTFKSFFTYYTMKYLINVYFWNTLYWLTLFLIHRCTKPNEFFEFQVYLIPSSTFLINWEKTHLSALKKCILIIQKNPKQFPTKSFLFLLSAKHFFLWRLLLHRRLPSHVKSQSSSIPNICIQICIRSRVSSERCIYF